MARASQATSTALRLTRTIAAPRERVFQAWTSPADLKRWAAPGDMVTAMAEVDLKVGGRFRIHMQAPDGSVHKAIGVYQLVEPPQRLVYTWSWEGEPELGDTLITVLFNDLGGIRTEVVFTHERFPSSEIRDRHQLGWNGCLDKFVTLF